MNKAIKNNVLVILSEMNNIHVDFANVLKTQIESSSYRNLKFHCLTDPSKKDIELFLQENKCVCIVPSSPFAVMGSDGGVYKARKFNIHRLMRTLGLDFFGCDYIAGLMLNDKAECLKLSGLNPTVRVVTRYNFNHNLLYETDSINCTSLMLTPYSLGSYHEMRKYKVCDTKDACQAISEIFINDSEVDEILVQMSANHNENIIITILGNPPLSIDFVCKSLESSEIEQLLDYNEDISELIAKSYELFNFYSLRDFCQFTFVRCQHEDKYYLADINGFNALSESFVASCMKRYGYDTVETLTILTIIFLCRQKLSHPVLELLSSLVKYLNCTPINRLLPLTVKTYIYNKHDFTDICNELEGRFLRPDESNKHEISSLLSKALRKHLLPKPILSPFLGDLDDKYTFLEKCEEIPLIPKNQEEILSISNQILSGQMRWHSPLTLYNVNPPTMFNTVVASALMNMYNPNPMARDTSAGLPEMEKQIVRQLSRLIGWDINESAGIFTPGGKVCISYAIKCGLNRCSQYSDKKPVVIFSEINHFSIESSCYMLGLPKSSLMSIPVNSNGTIDFCLFKEALIHCFENSTPIACVIFSGGNTTHCAIEDVAMGREAISWAVEKFNSPYEPYLYFDIVVGWPWLFFKGYDFTKNELGIEDEALRKIMHVTDGLKYSELADGAGIDFHKYGFAPFANSVFLTKKATELYQVSGVSVEEVFREPYHYTFSNSRGAADILSAWNVLQSVGVQGFQSYIANMVNVANVFTDELPYCGFEILDKSNTFGFATIAWACTPTDHMDFNTFIRQNENRAYVNSQYLYALTDYFRQHQKHAIQVRFLPKHKIVSRGLDVSVIIILPMTLNINGKNAASVARIMGIMKQEFDERCLAGLESYTDVIPEDAPK